MIENILIWGSILTLFELITYFMCAGGLHLVLFAGHTKTGVGRLIQSEQRRRDATSELKQSLKVILGWSPLNYIFFWGYFMGWTNIYSEVSQYGWPYFCFSLLLLMVFHDTAFFWTHRTLHTKRFWKIHEKHHQSRTPTAFAGYSLSVAEGYLLKVPFIVLFFFVPLHFSWIWTYTFIATFANMYAHSGVDILPARLERWSSRWFFTTATGHDRHHEFPNKGFGFYFPFWDKVMGSSVPTLDQRGNS